MLEAIEGIKIAEHSQKEAPLKSAISNLNKQSKN